MKVKVWLELEAEIEVPATIFVGMDYENADEFMKDPLLEHIAPLPKGSVVTVNNWEVIE